MYDPIQIDWLYEWDSFIYIFLYNLISPKKTSILIFIQLCFKKTWTFLFLYNFFLLYSSNSYLYCDYAELE